MRALDRRRGPSGNGAAEGGGAAKAELRGLVVLSAGSLLAFLALAELLLRGLCAIGLVELPRPFTVRDRWVLEQWGVDRDLHWVRPPDETGLTGGAEFRTNSRGLRDQEIPLEKPPGTYRILALGDSTVFGFGVPFAKSFSEVLETRLNADRSGKRFDVINAGVPGYSIYQSVVYAKRRGVRFDPDLIILETNFNDRRFVMSSDVVDSDAFYRSFYYRLRLKEIMGRSYLYRAMRRILVRELGLVESRLLVTGDAEYDSIPFDELHCRVSPDRYRELLAELIEVARERGLPVILVPLQHRPGDRYFFHAADELARDGKYEEAISMLRELDQREAVYGIVVARRVNELLRALGRDGEVAKSIDVRLKWMNTDGNIPVYLSDPYVAIMREAAEQEGVYLVELIDPLSFDRSEFYIDHIHLNEKGHRLLAERLYVALAEIGELPVGAGRPAAVRDSPGEGAGGGVGGAAKPAVPRRPAP